MSGLFGEGEEYEELERELMRALKEQIPPDRQTRAMQVEDAQNEMLGFIRSLNDDQLECITRIIGMRRDMTHEKFISASQQFAGMFYYESMIRRDQRLQAALLGTPDAGGAGETQVEPSAA